MTAIQVLDPLGVPVERLDQRLAELCPGATLHGPGVERADADPAAVRGLVTVKSPVDAARLADWPELAAVSVSFTGYDHIDLEACRSRGVAVSNVPSYSTDSVAELALGLAIGLLREIPAGDRRVRAGGWGGLAPGLELRGKTVGVIGTGRIGRRVAELFRAFGCEVLLWSRTSRPELADRIGALEVELETLLAKSRIVTVHVALNDATRGLIDAAKLGLMASDAYLINTARGPIVDEEALLEALRERRLAGAALDVFGQEPPTNLDLADVPGLIATPHVAFRTREALARKAEITLDHLARLLADESFEARLA